MPGVQGLVNSWVNLRKDSIVFHESSISTRKTSSSTTAKDSSVSRSTTTTRNNNKSIKRKKSSSSIKKPFPTIISDESTIATARTASTVITTSTGRSHGSSNSRSSNKSYSMSPLAPPCTQLPNMMMMPPPAMANEVVNVNTSATAAALKNTIHASVSSSGRADYVPRSQRNEINYQDTAPRNSYIPLQELQFTKRISEECYVGFYQSKSVLIKVLSQNINCTPKKWSQTISKLVSLNHPGLSRLYGWSEINPFSEEDKSYCLVQEYCESSQKTLESVLNEKGSSSSRSSDFKWKIIEEVANALEYLHSYNFVFGYLHPSKIILSESSSDGLPRGVKLMDYGYAYLLNRSLNNSVYRAPELLRGAPVSTAGDMYAFMTIAHELFTGLHPSKFLMGRTNKLPKQLMGFIHVSRSQDPNERPTLSTVLQILPELKRSCCGGSSSSLDNLNKSNHSLVSSSTNSMVSSSEAANKSSLNVKSNNKQRGGFQVFGPSTGKRRSLFALRDKSSKSASASLKSSVSSEYIDNKNDSSIYSGKTSTTSVRGPPKKAAKKNLSIFSKKFFKNSSKRNKEIEESSSSIMDDSDRDSHQDILSSNDNRSHTSEQKSDQDIEEVLLEQQGQGSTSSIKTQTEFVGAPPPPLAALAAPLVQPILPRTLLHVSKPQDKVNEEALIEETSSLTLPEVSKNTIQPISQPGIPFVHIVHDGEDHFKSFIERNSGSSISNSSLTAFNMDKLNEYGELAQHNSNNETQTVSSSSNYTQSNQRQIKRTYSCPSLDTSVYSQLSSTNKLPSLPRRSHSTQPPSLAMQQQQHHHQRVNSADNNMAFSSSSSVMPIKPMAHRGLMISLPSQLEPHQQAKPLSLPSTIMEDEPMNLSSNDSHNNTLMDTPDPVPSSTTNTSLPSINDDESMASASTATANEEDVEIAASILTSQFRSP